MLPRILKNRRWLSRAQNKMDECTNKKTDVITLIIHI